jgi:2-keto-4-pentenoate hydratase/2-oxohepta-3-ene-1,7-dioic acid hydratase in catechol pathway
MRYVRFQDLEGNVQRGKWTEDGIHGNNTIYDRDRVDLLAPVRPTKLVCAARNYRGGVDEPPDDPDLFLKAPNAVADPRSEVSLPSHENIFFEGEIAVVVGERCRNVPRKEAMAVVEGFTCANDISDRSVENTVRRKSFDGAAPLGPAVAPPDEVPTDASIEVRINGRVEQSSDRTKLIYGVPDLMADITSRITLEPGDVLLTGSPSGMDTLDEGDVVEVEIEGVGTLCHSVR